ncbi:MAG: hypothetical protein P8X96_19780 [Desulfobacteraceae bacterium]
MTTAPDLTAAAIKMIMALGVVLLLVWGIYRLAKGRLAATPGGRHRKMMHLIESQYVGVKKLQRLTTPGQRKITKTEEDGSVTAP